MNTIDDELLRREIEKRVKIVNDTTFIIHCDVCNQLFNNDTNKFHRDHRLPYGKFCAMMNDEIIRKILIDLTKKNME